MACVLLSLFACTCDDDPPPERDDAGDADADARPRPRDVGPDGEDDEDAEPQDADETDAALDASSDADGDAGPVLGGRYTALGMRVYRASRYPDGDRLVTGIVPNPRSALTGTVDQYETLVARLSPDGVTRWTQYSDRGELPSVGIFHAGVFADGTAVIAGHASPIQAAMATFEPDGSPRWLRQWQIGEESSVFAAVDTHAAHVVAVGTYSFIVLNSIGGREIKVGLIAAIDEDGSIGNVTSIGVTGATGASDEPNVVLYAASPLGEDTVALGTWTQRPSFERDAVVVRVDASGAVAWAKRFDGGMLEEGRAVGAVGDHIAIAGMVASGTSEASAIWVALLDASGNFERGALVPRTGSFDNVGPVAVLAHGAEELRIVSGAFTTTLDLAFTRGTIALSHGERSPDAVEAFCSIARTFPVAVAAWTEGDTLVQAGYRGTAFGGCWEGFLSETVDGALTCASDAPVELVPMAYSMTTTDALHSSSGPPEEIPVSIGWSAITIGDPVVQCPP